jgi:hypothetical protein
LKLGELIQVQKQLKKKNLTWKQYQVAHWEVFVVLKMLAGVACAKERKKKKE